MKFIFDFDDVLFNNTRQLKERMFRLIAEAGVPENEAREYYRRPEVRGYEFSLKKFIGYLFDRFKIKEDQGALYEKIMWEQELSTFLNTELMAEIDRVGMKNCYIVTNGDVEFNTDKLKRSGIWEKFGNGERIRIVPKSKREAISEICTKNSGEQVVFIDDKEIFLSD